MIGPTVGLPQFVQVSEGGEAGLTPRIVASGLAQRR
jgi:hypothetical protein